MFVVSIRKDIDDGSFKFPEPYELELRLKDMLEDEVDEKYYLSDAMINYVLANGTKNYQKPIEIDNEIARTINTTPTSHRSGIDNFITEQYHETGVPMSTEQVLKIKNATKKGYLEAEEGDGIDISGRMEYHRGTVQKGMSQTLSTAGGNNVGVVVKDSSLLKTKLCNDLIEKEVVHEGDVINHSYTNGGNGKNPNSRQKLEDYIESKNGVMPTLTTRCDTLGVVVKDTKNYIQWKQKGELDKNCRAYKGDKVGPTIITNHTPKVLVEDKRGNEFPLYKDTKALRETIENNEFELGEPLNLDLYNRKAREESQTLSTGHNEQRLFDGLRIRKLTPKECFRLMGFEDDCIDILIENGMSNTQLYKMAGNSIVVDVLEEIFVELLNLNYIDLVA